MECRKLSQLQFPFHLLHAKTSPLRINAYRPRPAMVNDKPQGGQFMPAQPAGDQPDDAIWREVRKLWQDYLNPVPDSYLSPELSVVTRTFMSTLGLPERYLGFWFYHDERLLAPIARFGRTYQAFGNDGSSRTIFGIEHGTDETYYLGPYETQPVFINSNLPLTVCFFGLLETRMDEISACDTKAEAQRIADELYQQFKARDQPSVTGDHNWWNQMLYDVGEGELT